MDILKRIRELGKSKTEKDDHLKKENKVCYRCNEDTEVKDIVYHNDETIAISKVRINDNLKKKIILFVLLSLLMVVFESHKRFAIEWFC